MPGIVTTERDGRVLTVKIHNPPRNFMNVEMIEGLYEVVDQVEADRSIGAVVITGAVDGYFIAHYDVEEIAQSASAPTRAVSRRTARGVLRFVAAASRIAPLRRALLSTQLGPLFDYWRSHEMSMAMNRSSKVYVAAINGTALGGGCETALACDIRLMADRDDARIGQPELSLGLIPGAGGTQRLARMLGPARVLKLMLDSQLLTPSEALDLGLVHQVVPPDKLLEEAHALAELYARRSPISVALAKREVYEAASWSHPKGLADERAAFVAASSSPPSVRAMEAYLAALADTRAHPNPWADAEFTEPWRRGMRVDMTE